MTVKENTMLYNVSVNATLVPGDEPYFVSRWEHSLMACYLCTLGIVSTVGNGLTATVLISNKKTRYTPNNLLLFNLAAADLGVSILGFPFTTASAFAGHWLFGDTLCVIEGFSVTMFCCTAINILLALSIVRYIIICKPQHQHILNRFEVKVAMVASVWGWSIMWSAFPLVGWSSYTYEHFGTSCSVKWDGETIGDNTYNFALIIFEYLIHGIIMIYCYYHVIVTSSRILNSLNKNTQQSADDQIAASRKRSQAKVSTMILLMVVVYNVVWAPYAWLSLVVIVSPGALPKWAFTWPTMFAKLSSASNPLVYSLTNPHFRDAVKEKIQEWRGRAQVADMPPSFKDQQTKDGIYIGTERERSNDEIF